MIQNIVVEVAERAESGKNAARRIRKAGQVPGIVYGLDIAPFAVTVARRRVEEILGLESGRNTIFTLALAGQDKTRAAMIKSLQRDPVTEVVLHVDLVRVDLEKTVRVNVPIRILGIADGVKNQGGVGTAVCHTAVPDSFPSQGCAPFLNPSATPGSLRKASFLQDRSFEFRIAACGIDTGRCS